ncbi:MAG: hypothetical protein WBE92_15990 [Steroidobacteraceae bacterium]
MSPIDPALREVPDAMLVECGLHASGATAPAWRCDEPNAELVPVVELRVPAARGLDPERLRSLLLGVAACDALPAVPVYRAPEAVVVLNGMHRVAVARAVGFTHVPCLAVDLDEARHFYRYPEGQR